MRVIQHRLLEAPVLLHAAVDVHARVGRVALAVKVGIDVELNTLQTEADANANSLDVAFF